MTEGDAAGIRSVAPDARVALEAFFANGGRSFEQLGVADARASYSASSARNGLPSTPVEQVVDVEVTPDVRVRRYDPRAAADRTLTPLIVFIHGGGWVMGDLQTHDSLCRQLASLTGIPVAAVDYRLAPEHPYPAALEDCRTALRWASTLPEVTGIVVVGDSAGGQLAAVLARECALDAAVGSRSEAEAPAPLLAQVLLYPVTDLTMSSDSYARVTTGLPLTARTMAWFADQYVPAGLDRTVPELSPLLASRPSNLAPAYICTVDNDPLADEGIAYAAALARSGTAVRSVHLTGYAHGLFTTAGIIEQGARQTKEVAAFIRAVAVSAGPG